MKRIARPLVAVIEDQDPRPALSRAIKLALANEAELTLLQVSERLPEEPKAIIPESTLREMEAAMREKRDSELGALGRMAEDAGVMVRTVQRQGTPFLVTIREVLRGGHDLVLKTAGGTKQGARVFDATDKHLLRKCPRAVWLITPGAPEKHERILAAVDPDPTDTQLRKFSAEVLAAAVDVAQMDGVALDVLHAWSMFGESILRGPHITVSDPEVDYMVGNAMNRHAKSLDDLVDAVSGSGTEIERHLVRGSPDDAIISFVQSNKVGLLVMGTVGRAGIPGLLIGNTAERVIDEVDCSILALKPRGFVSPVALDA